MAYDERHPAPPTYGEGDESQLAGSCPKIFRELGEDAFREGLVHAPGLPSMARTKASPTASTALCSMNAPPELLDELLVAVGKGDKHAFRRLYDATSAKLRSILVARISRYDLAEEALQECFIKAWQKASSYDPARGPATTWLATLARNHSVDLFRGRRPDEWGRTHPTACGRPYPPSFAKMRASGVACAAMHGSETHANRGFLGPLAGRAQPVRRRDANPCAPPQSTWDDERISRIDQGMAFSPWHGLAAHRPLGSIMRVRKSAYEMSEQFRAGHSGHAIEGTTASA